MLCPHWSEIANNLTIYLYHDRLWWDYLVLAGQLWCLLFVIKRGYVFFVIAWYCSLLSDTERIKITWCVLFHEIIFVFVYAFMQTRLEKLEPVLREDIKKVHCPMQFLCCWWILLGLVYDLIIVLPILCLLFWRYGILFLSHKLTKKLH